MKMEEQKDRVQLAREAWLFAKTQHKGQLDDDGNSYFEAHLVPVADIIRYMTSDPEIVAAAFLHDILEDTNVTYDQLKWMFNERVANLVSEVTHEGTNDHYGYYFPRLKSRDAIMIKLADRLSNIARMDSWDISRQEDYLKHTLFWKTGEDRPCKSKQIEDTKTSK